jgi:enamine deaminase RidA (YjgF/YER057c/UK114 family)
MDFAGLNAAYSQYFGSAAQPNKPVRTALQVAALPMPGGLVEIEMTAAKPLPAASPPPK